jgi:hypothetical protein
MNKNSDEVTTAQAAARIRLIRGRAVLFVSDIAALYDVTDAEIASVVERQPEIFPDDFVGRLPQGELVFNEQGASMLVAFLSNTHRVDVGIAVMRAFVLLRRKHPPARLAAAATRTKRLHAGFRSPRAGLLRNRNSKI